MCVCRSWWHQWWKRGQWREIFIYLMEVSSGRIVRTPRCLMEARSYRITLYPWRMWLFSYGEIESHDCSLGHLTYPVRVLNQILKKKKVHVLFSTCTFPLKTIDSASRLFFFFLKILYRMIVFILALYRSNCFWVFFLLWKHFFPFLNF